MARFYVWRQRALVQPLLTLTHKCVSLKLCAFFKINVAIIIALLQDSTYSVSTVCLFRIQLVSILVIKKKVLMIRTGVVCFVPSSHDHLQMVPSFPKQADRPSRNNIRDIFHWIRPKHPLWADLIFKITKKQFILFRWLELEACKKLKRREWRREDGWGGA